MSRPRTTSTRYVAPFEPFEQKEAFQDLRKLMRAPRKPIVLVGAGASVASGYPTWPKLLERLREASGEKLKRVWRRNLEDLGDALWTAEVFTRKFKTGQLQSFIATEFGRPCVPAEPHPTLARLGFSHYLTTNYDPCIERALESQGVAHKRIHWSDGRGLSEFLMCLSDPHATPRVVHLHGAHDSPTEADVILRERDYVARYVVDDGARRKLMAIFMTQPVVLVGFSMNDPDLASMLREVTARLDPDRPAHFALMGYKTEEERDVTRDRMTRKFGVRPVFFSRTPSDPTADEYSNLLLLLDALSGKAPARAKIAAAAAPLRATPDADDPNKGFFGGLAETASRRLSVRKTGGSRAEGELWLDLTVESLAGHPLLEGEVTFHLHPTFSRSVVTVIAKNGRATLNRWSYGAFTVGVEADAGETRLELDLAHERDLPLWFRRN